ncbi:MAG: SoxR reducing system RseC family protein [Treponema sp.]|nr:SoxR reducing system RseC family protein [Treponema sp.]
MNSVYKVQSVKNDAVIVAPVIDSSSCQNCSKRCSSCTLAFSVFNSKNIPLQEGQKVTIKMSAKNELKQAVFSLVFPIASAVLGFFLASIIRISENDVAQSSFCALVSVVFLVLAGSFVLLYSKKSAHPERIEIQDIAQ